VKNDVDVRYYIAALSVLMAALGVHLDASAGAMITDLKQQGKRMKFSNIFEPSGFLQLADGQLLLIEDEPVNPFSICRLEDSEGKPVIGAPVYCRMANTADDLEGLTHGPGDWLYAITSHSRTGSGEVNREREKLLRFKIDEKGGLQEYMEHGELLPAMLDALHSVDPTVNSINVEGLSSNWDRTNLLIGLREPVVAGASLVLTLINPAGMFERGELPQFASEVIRLPLKGGGIRDIAFVEQLGGYLIANEILQENGKLRACLWLWDGVVGHEARRLDFPGSGKLKNIEGISPVMVQNKAMLLLVCDDGDRQEGDTAHYRFIEYDQISKSSSDN
jgi:hypothetical protein